MQFALKTLGPWSYYHSPGLEKSGIVQGFMTRSSDPIISDAGETLRFTEALDAPAAVIMQQEHGDGVHVVEKGERPGAGDGLVLLERGVIGVIKTADCLPVILYDSGYPMAAIVHAGWRGTARRITGKALQLMVTLGAKRERIAAIIGPGIGPCCYEVGEEVVAEFRRAGFSEGNVLKKGGATFLDLKKANREMIEAEEIKCIHDVNLCTSCRQDLFFSARRDAQGGRQVNFVQLKR
jgi:polyphenol oxidase